MVLACLVGVRAEEEAVITLDASNFDTGAWCDEKREQRDGNATVDPIRSAKVEVDTSADDDMDRIRRRGAQVRLSGGGVLCTVRDRSDGRTPSDAV